MQGVARVSGRTRFLLGVLIVGAVAVTGCGGAAAPHSGPVNPAPPNQNVATAVADAEGTGAAVDPRIVAADNAFGFSLLRLLNEGATTNVAISPISVALVLQMIYNGAAGSTQQGMANALQLGGLSALDVDQANAALQAHLLTEDPQVQLVFANSLWMHLTSNPVLPSFIDTNTTYYAAKIGDLAGAPANVNAWVAEATNGLITDILPQQNFAAVDAIIANTIYFKGAWTTAFDAGQTRPASFTLADGTQSMCQMMHQTGTFDYLQGQGFQMLRLPYGQGRLSMLVLLPSPGVSLEGLIASLTSSEFQASAAQLTAVYGSVALPRFISNYGVGLPAALTTLGMGVAFDPNAADLSGIAPATYLSGVAHKTVVEVDEHGTVAAAVTVATIGVTAVESPQFDMVMDRPFFYVIRDDETGTLLFMGTLVKPT